MSNVLHGVGREARTGQRLQHWVDAYGRGHYTEVARAWVEQGKAFDPKLLLMVPSALESVGWSLALTKQWTAFASFRKQVSLLETDPHVSQQLTALDAWNAIQEARYDAALLMVRSLRQGCSDQPMNVRTLGHALKVEGVALFRLGRYDDAEQSMRRALDLFELANDSMQVSHCATNLGLILNARGEIRAARQELMRAHRVLVEHEAAAERIALARENLAITEVHLGNVEAATTLGKSALETFEKLGLRSEQITALNGLGHCARMRGHFDRAKHYYERALDMAQPDLHRQVGLSCEFLGQLHFDLDDFEVAEEYYRRALDVASGISPDGDLMVEASWRYAELLTRQNRLEEAEEFVERAEELCAKWNDRRELGCVQRARARLLVAQGQHARAHEVFEASVKTLEVCGRRFECAVAWLARAQDTPHANPEPARTALEIFAEIATPSTWTDRARALVIPSNDVATAVQFGFITRDQEMAFLLEDLAQAASTPYPILLTGESGTGKELLARGIHRLGSYRGEFVAINCAALPKDLVESELFGHHRGSFSGAHAEKVGLFEHANQGVLMLDEVGEMPLEIQGKLLRVLEGGRLRRVGGLQERQINVKVVAATNRPLEEAIEEGRFRLDLYHRLAVHMGHVKPLRERPMDLLPIAEHFLEVEGLVERLQLSAAFVDSLRSQTWPGNVRELRNYLIRSAFARVAVGRRAGQGPADKPASLRDQNSLHERLIIENMLQKTGGNLSAASRELGMHVTTLRRKIRKLGVRR